jgi:hypothetical protein
MASGGGDSYFSWDAVVAMIGTRWQAAHECSIPMHFHTLGPKQDMTWLSDHRSRRMWFATLLAGFQMSMVEAMAAIIYSGALERLSNPQDRHR